MTNIAYAGLTLLIILVISRVFQGAISRLSILLGLVVGTVDRGGRRQGRLLRRRRMPIWSRFRR